MSTSLTWPQCESTSKHPGAETPSCRSFPQQAGRPLTATDRQTRTKAASSFEKGPTAQRPDEQELLAKNQGAQGPGIA